MSDPANTRGRRLRVSVDIDCYGTQRLDVAAQHLAAAFTRTASELNPQLWTVYGTQVLDVSTGTIIRRWDAHGREYNRVDVETGEIIP